MRNVFDILGRSEKDSGMSERDLGRLEEGLRNIEKAIERSDASRKQLYDKIDGVDTKVTQMEMSIQHVTKELNEMKPTVAEYMSVKHKVAGAGWLGKMLWAAGGIILTAALWLYQNLPLPK